MLYAPIFNNKPIKVNKSIRSILAVFAAGIPKRNNLNSPINPYNQKWYPK